MDNYIDDHNALKCMLLIKTYYVRTCPVSYVMCRQTWTSVDLIGPNFTMGKPIMISSNVPTTCINMYREYAYFRMNVLNVNF